MRTLYIEDLANHDGPEPVRRPTSPTARGSSHRGRCLSSTARGRPIAARTSAPPPPRSREPARRTQTAIRPGTRWTSTRTTAQPPRTTRSLSPSSAETKAPLPLSMQLSAWLDESKAEEPSGDRLRAQARCGRQTGTWLQSLPTPRVLAYHAPHWPSEVLLQKLVSCCPPMTTSRN